MLYEIYYCKVKVEVELNRITGTPERIFVKKNQ